MTDIETIDQTARSQQNSGLSETERPAAEREAFLSDEFKETFFYCLKIFLGVRLLLGLLAVLATALLEPNVATAVPGWDAPVQTPGWHNFFSAWERWDALWFLRIAIGGYEDSDLSAAFFPLYPLLVRGVSLAVGAQPLAAALLVSNVAFLGALVVVFELTRDVFGRPIAKRAVLYMAIFPTAYFFIAPYTESLFLLLTAGAFLAARRGRWEWAGLCGALAAGTRSLGLILVLPLVVQAILQWRERRAATASEDARFRPDRGLVIALAWSSFVVVGTVSYLFFWQRFNGDWFTPINDQNGWLREFSFPWTSYLRGTQEAFRFIGQYAGGYHQIDWIFVTVALGILVWLFRKIALPYWLYGALSLLVPMSFIFGGRPFMSMPRFILPIFPVFWGLALLAERFRVHDLIVAVSAAGLGIMTVLFVNWYFVF